MRAWAAPCINGERIDAMEIEVPTDGLTVQTHSLPWSNVAYRYELEPGEEIPTRPLLTKSSRTDEELTEPASLGYAARLWKWLIG